MGILHMPTSDVVLRCKSKWISCSTQGKQYLCTAIADGQLPSGHASRREGSNLVSIIYATHSNDIILVSRIVEGAI